MSRPTPDGRKEYIQKYKAQNREKLISYGRNYFLKNRNQLLKKMKERYEKTKPKTLRQTISRNISNIKSKCLSTGVPFNITINDVVIPRRCPLLGIELRAGLPRNSAESPSIDRIVPSLGYVKGNVWVISNRANILKNDATLEELEMLTENLRKKTRESVR